MARLNRVPRGLQSLLGTKALGRNPQELLEAVRPTVDLTQFYLAETVIRSASGVTTLQTPVWGDFLGELEIPAGESWFVYNVSLQVTSVAAEIVNVNFGYTLPSTPPNIMHVFNNQMDYATTRTVNPVNMLQKGYQFPTPTLFSAGTQFKAQITNQGAVGTNSMTTRIEVAYVLAEI